MKICDFNGSRRIGPPKGWDAQLDGECGDIYVADAVDPVSGLRFMYSVYKPTPADLEALNAGGLLRLGIAAPAHPVFQLGVLSPKVAEMVRPIEKGDLGPVIDLE